MPRATFPIVAAILLLVLAGKAIAYVPADLDRGFGHGGVAVSPPSPLRIATRHNLIETGSDALAVVDRSRQIAGGCVYDTQLEWLRLADGALEGSQAFPANATCPTPIPAEVAVGRDAAGRAYVALGEGSSIHLTRLLADGAADPAFGVGGTEILATPRPVVPELLRVGSDESVLLAGVAAPREGAGATETFLARAAGGGFDPAFGEGGISFFDVGLGESTPEPSALAVGRKGDIYLAGPLVKASGGHQLTPAGVRAFLPDGTADRRFGKAGFVRLSGPRLPRWSSPRNASSLRSTGREDRPR